MRWLTAALLIFATAAQAQTPLTGTTGAPLSPRTGVPVIPAAPKPMGAPSPSAVPPASAMPPASATPSASTMAPATGSGTGAAAAHTGRRRKLQERFDDANTTHDGHLTQEQARAKMPSVARDFDAIDTGHKGYVTVDQIKEYRKARGAARRAARAAKAQ